MIEHEVKLAAWPGFTLPDLDGVADGANTRRRETVDLDATYFDTADLRLGRRGITLRHRRRGARETWTLKLPSDDAVLDGALARNEIDVAAPAGEVPEELALLVAAHVRTAGLTRVARLTTVRRRTVVEGADGLPFAEIDDDEVSVMDGGRVAARFRELEVEIAPDAPAEVAAAVVERLRRAGADPADSMPKVARALGPRFFEAPEAVPMVLPDDPTAAEAVEAALRASVTRLLDHHALAVLGDDPEGVHQMRVAARRLRSDLQTFRPLLDRTVTDPLRLELRWIGAVLGEVRDPDVLAERIQRGIERCLQPSDQVAAQGVLDHLDADRDRGVSHLHEALGSDRYLLLVEALVALAEDPPTLEVADGPAAEVLPGLVRKPWKRLRDMVDGAGEDPPDDLLHDIRKRAKAVRYAAEAVEPVVGKPAKKAAKGARRVQDVLGEHQDTVVAETWMRDQAALPGRDAAAVFVLGALVADERVERARLRDAWRAEWDEVSGKDRWAWTR